jgi:hypothetical protein
VGYRRRIRAGFKTALNLTSHLAGVFLEGARGLRAAQFTEVDLNPVTGVRPLPVERKSDNIVGDGDFGFPNMRLAFDDKRGGKRNLVTGLSDRLRMFRLDPAEALRRVVCFAGSIDGSVVIEAQGYEVFDRVSLGCGEFFGAAARAVF